jgi:hypothetical protein
MKRRGCPWALSVGATLAFAGLIAASAGAGARHGDGCRPSRSACAATPVPSLEPEATAALWRSLVQRPRRLRTQAECRPLRGVFYAATDWLRLATKLAASRSSCADYFISIPPIVGDKTNLRPDQAVKIRALGTNFHALAEIHWTSWSSWVSDNGTTWYAAGVEARRRMAQAGFNVAAGDTWAVNEFPSSVRSGAGTARASARDLVRGLYEGDGSRAARGVVFIVGLGQPTTNVAVYQTNLQNWLADTAFWTDMSAFVSDWSQEVYGDYRRHAVPGASVTTRRDYLNDYLQHALVVARAGPPTIEPARGYLPNAFSPLANAAWQYESGYGWTMIPVDQMQAYVSAQVYALRSFSVAAGLERDQWGFAWQPRNGSGLSAGDFAAQTGAILDRLAAAIRDSGDTADPNDPGAGACGPPGQNRYCGGDLAGAQFAEQWKAFRAWSEPVLAFATPPQAITAGQPSAPIGLALVSSSGAPQVATTPIAVTLSSSSPQGQFSVGPAGPWTSTLAVTIPAGGNAAAPFYYLDTRAARPQLKATAVGVTTATQVETVGPGPPSFLRVDPGSASLGPRQQKSFAVTAEDAFGNPVSVRPTWTVTPAGLGAVKPKTGVTTTLTAGGRGGRGLLRATVPSASVKISAIATVFVRPGPIRVASIRYVPRGGILRVTATVVEVGGGPARGVRTSAVVRRNGRWTFSGRKRTDPNGRATYLVPLNAGCYRTTVTSVTAPGYRWNGRTPANRFCR